MRASSDWRRSCPCPSRWRRPPRSCVALVKPQFEVGPDRVGKGSASSEMSNAPRPRPARNVADWLRDVAGWTVLDTAQESGPRHER